MQFKFKLSFVHMVWLPSFETSSSKIPNFDQKILDFDKNLLVDKMCPQIGFYLILHSFINYVYTVSRIKLG